MEFSNRALAVLLVVAIVISMGGAMINIARLSELAAIVPFAKGVTGYGVTGIVNVSLWASANLNVTQTFVDFGVGYVTGSRAGAELKSDGNYSNWTAVPDLGGAKISVSPLAIENIGNVNLSVSVVSNKNAATYFGGGTTPAFQFNATNKEPSTCYDTLQGTFTDILGTGDGNTKNVCRNMSFVSTRNELYVDVRLYIPYDTPTGNKTAIWTFNATQSG